LLDIAGDFDLRTEIYCTGFLLDVQSLYIAVATKEQRMPDVFETIRVGQLETR